MKASLDFYPISVRAPAEDQPAAAGAAHTNSRAECALPLPLPPSIAQIYDDYFDFVWRNVRRLGVPEASADDVTQDVFMIVHRRIDAYDGRASMRSWIFGILVRVAQGHRRSYRRKDARHVPLELDVSDCSASGLSEPAPIERLERARLVEQLLSELDEDKRTILILAELEEWTLREIAAFYGSHISTVNSRLRVAKRAFAQAYSRVHAAEEPSK